MSDINLLDITDRMNHEISMVQYIQLTANSKELEGLAAILADRMNATKDFLQLIIQGGVENDETN